MAGEVGPDVPTDTSRWPLAVRPAVAEPSTMDPDDPQHAVEAPIRGALYRVIGVGLGLVAVVLIGAVAPAIPALRGMGNGVAVAVTATLVLYGCAVPLVRRLRSPIDDAVRASAWYKAREIAPEDTMLALVFAGWVPVALAAALVMMMWPHLNDPNPALRGAWAVIGIPPVVAAWVFATTAWLDACRDILARAIGESDRRFRSYWANVGR